MPTNLRLPWLLVATPQLLDPNFQRTVVLVVEHNQTGSMGFVINRPLRTPVADIVASAPAPIPRAVPAWYGGPVGSQAGIILHQGEPLATGGRAFSVSASEKTLLEMIEDAKTRLAELDAADDAPPPDAAVLYPYRFVVGYAGWGPGQLENEIRAGSWIQVPATQDLVFGVSWKRLWEQALGGIGVVPRSIAPASQIYLN